MGEIAAIATAACWAASSVFFTSASRQIGALAVNRIRLLLAVILLLVAHLALTGQLLPWEAEPYRWLWLGLSGIVGLVVGDTLLFNAFKHIGFRLGMLVMASAPVLAALGAWIFLGEQLSVLSLVGMGVCLAGIGLVVMERTPAENGRETDRHQRREYVIGLLYALGGAAGQAGGLILAKLGLGGDFPSISGTVMRMLVSALAIWALALLGGQARPTLKHLFVRSGAFRPLLGGSLVGPFLGVWLSQFAVQRAYVGVASTLMALTPIFLLPVAGWLYHERISMRAVTGTVIALAGVAIIFL